MRADFLRRRGHAAILLSLGLGLSPAFAESTTADRPWTDPPAKTAVSSPPAVANPPPTLPKSSLPKSSLPKSSSPKQDATRERPMTRTRMAAKPRRPHLAETRSDGRVRRTVAERPFVRESSARKSFATQTSAARPVVARMPRPPAYAQRPPEGRFEGFEMDERSRRIRAAEEAGFLVVRSRTVEFPDGRRMRTYTPYEEPDDAED